MSTPAEHASMPPRWSLTSVTSADKVASALKTRGRWRSLAISMVEAHTPVGKDKCRCDTRWPCLTLSIMEQRDPYARREAEKSADSRALSEQEMKRMVQDVFDDLDEDADEYRRWA